MPAAAILRIAAVDMRRLARTVSNPRTGRAMTIKASIAPVFRAAKNLKDLVNRR